MDLRLCPDVAEPMLAVDTLAVLSSGISCISGTTAPDDS